MSKTDLKPSTSTTPDSNSGFSENLWEVVKILLITAAATLAFLVVMVLISAGFAGWIGYRYVTTFTETAGTNLSQLQNQVEVGLKQEVSTHQGRIYFLLLGTDQLPDRNDETILTDTMILASLNLKTGDVALVSLPRDLWSTEYQTKINSLYHYGLERNPENPQQFPREVISDLVGLPIDHVIVIEPAHLSELIDLVGGVPIDIETGFTDTQFPRTLSDSSSDEQASQDVYQTVTFEAGYELMFGERAMQYMRSRKAPGEAGTDLARSQRQQQVIAALTKQMAEPQFLLDPQRMGLLYKFYVEHFSDILDLSQLVAIAAELARNEARFQLASHQLSMYPLVENGVIYHPYPGTRYQNLWVYEVRDQASFRREVCVLLDCHNNVNTDSPQN